jgi:large repetitive protein
MFFRSAFSRWQLVFAFLFAVPGIAAAATITPPTYPAIVDGFTSATLTMTLSAAPTTGVTVTPNAAGVTFSPSAISFVPGQTNATFTVTMGPNTGPGAVAVTYTLGGPDAAAYATPSAGTIQPLGVFTPPTFPLTTKDGQTTSSLTMTASFGPPVGVTITPSGIGLTFSPAAITFGSGTTSQPFTVTAGASAGPGPIVVTYAVSGANAASYVTPTANTFTTLGTFTPPSYGVDARSYFGISDYGCFGCASNGSYDNALGSGTDV